MKFFETSCRSRIFYWYSEENLWNKQPFSTMDSESHGTNLPNEDDSYSDYEQDTSYFSSHSYDQDSFKENENPGEHETSGARRNQILDWMEGFRYKYI